MKQFIRSLFSDTNGSVSSKRTVMFALIVTFIIVIFVNLFTGRKITEVLQDQLFYLVIYSLAAIFGEQIADVFKKKTP